MYVTKMINVMSTDTLSPGVEWCNEAYENADVILYHGNFYKKYYLDTLNNVVYFSIFGISTSYISFSRLSIKKDYKDINIYSKHINF